MILFELQSGTFARLEPADIIKSVVDEFDGFGYGKVLPAEVAHSYLQETIAQLKTKDWSFSPGTFLPCQKELVR